MSKAPCIDTSDPPEHFNHRKGLCQGATNMKRYWTAPTGQNPSLRAFAAFPDPKPADIPTDPYLADYLARSLHSNRASLIRAYAWLKERKL